jgi:hypothetical protein
MSERPRKLVIPPSSPFPLLNAARDELVGLEEQRRLTGIAIDSRIEDRDNAERLDLKAQSRAIREDKPDPGFKKRDKIDKEIEQFKVKYAALTMAVVDASDEVEALIEASREEWVALAQEAAESAREAYLTALASALDANRGVRSAYALLRWAAQAPNVKAFKESGGMSSLRAPSSDPYPVDALLGALIEEAEIVPSFDQAPEREGTHAVTREEAIARVLHDEEMHRQMGLAPRPIGPTPGTTTLPPNTIINE